MSYPYFWDHPTAKPAAQDLVGAYQIKKIRLSDELTSLVSRKPPSLDLRADGTATLAIMPSSTASET
jgi:hypothetical protein